MKLKIYLALIMSLTLLNASNIDTSGLKKAKITKINKELKVPKAPPSLDERFDAKKLLAGIKPPKMTQKALEQNLVPPKVLQKMVDEPKDRTLEVMGSDGYTYCYNPMSTGYEGYATLWYCKYSKPARYDVFRRISFDMDGLNLCLTAPRDVLYGDTAWDYIRVRPCAINDEAQFWTFSNGGFHSKIGNYRIKDYKSYLYISKNPKDYNDHSLTTNMKSWLKTVARPSTIAIKTELGWFNDNFGKRVSAKDEAGAPLYYYYNVENGQFFYYKNEQVKGNEIICLTSSSLAGHTWDWTEDVPCKDFEKGDEFKWRLLSNGDWGVSFIDHNGKILRTQRYGPDWGETYTADIDFVPRDTSYSPTSYFLLDSYFKKYFNYYHGNIAQNLEYCPAIGDGNRKISPLKMPLDYNFSEDWLRALYAIGSTDTQAGAQEQGICGVCFLQSMEMMYQLANSYPSLPNYSGHFFHYQRDTDPFNDLRTRHSILHDTLQDIRTWFRVPLFVGESVFARTARYTSATLQSMLSNYDFIQSSVYETPAGVDLAIHTLAQAPVGSVYFVAMVTTDAHGTREGHAQVAVSTSRGLVVIQTNTYTLSFEDFRAQLMPTRDPARVRQLLDDTGTLDGIVLYQMTPLNPFAQPLNLGVSQYDCSGGGVGHRGSNSAINRRFINQCLSGRCDLPY